MGFSAVAAAMAAYSAYSGNKADQQQRSAQRQAASQAEASAKAADEASNKASQRGPDVAGTLASVTQASKAGASGTMLTGPQGVDPNGTVVGQINSSGTVK